MKRPDMKALVLKMKENKKMMRVVTGLVVISLFVVGRDAWMDTKASKSFYGTLEIEESSVCAKTAGVIKSLDIEEGIAVKSNETIGQIDPNDDSLRLQQSQLALDTAQNDLEAMDEGARQEEIAIQEATIKQMKAQHNQSLAQAKKMESLIIQAKANLKTAESVLKQRAEAHTDAKALYDSGALSEENLINAATQLDTATNAFDGAKAALSAAEADLSAIRSQADALQYQVQAAESKLAMLQTGATERSMQSGQYAVDKSKLSVDLAASALEKTKITSLVNGRIQSLNYHVGEYVVPGSIIATVANEAMQSVKVYVPEKALPSLEVGQKLEVISTVGGQTTVGTVVHISDKAIYTPLNIVTVKDREKLVFEVKIKIDKADPLIKAGTLVEVKLP